MVEQELAFLKLDRASDRVDFSGSTEATPKRLHAGSSRTSNLDDPDRPTDGSSAMGTPIDQDAFLRLQDIEDSSNDSGGNNPFDKNVENSATALQQELKELDSVAEVSAKSKAALQAKLDKVVCSARL